MKKFWSIILAIIIIAGVGAGGHYGYKYFKDYKQPPTASAAYDKLIEDLNRDLAVSLENVANLEATIELNGLEISTLTQSVIGYKNQVETLENSVTAYETSIVDKEAQIAAKTEAIAELEAALEVSEDENSELEAQLSNLVAEKETLEKEVAELKADKINLETIVEEKNFEIEAKMRLISEKDAAIEELNATLSENQETISDLNNQIETLSAEIASLSESGLAKDEEIERLNVQVTDLQSQVSELNAQTEELNQTIFDLNTRIDILEETIANGGTFEKDPNKTYIDDLLLDDHFLMEARFLELNENELLIFRTEQTYILDLTNYSVEIIFEDRVDNYSKTSRGDLFLFWYSLNGFYIYDTEFEFIESSYSNFDILYFNAFELGENGCVLRADVDGAACAFIFNYNDYSLVYVEKSSSYCYDTTFGIFMVYSAGSSSNSSSLCFIYDDLTFEIVTVDLYINSCIVKDNMAILNRGVLGNQSSYYINFENKEVNVLFENTQVTKAVENDAKTGLILTVWDNSTYFFDYSTETLTEYTEEAAA